MSIIFRMITPRELVELILNCSGVEMCEDNLCQIDHAKVFQLRSCIRFWIIRVLQIVLFAVSSAKESVHARSLIVYQISGKIF